MLPKNSDLGLKKPVTIKYLPRDFKYPPTGSRLWKLCNLQGSHILYCWYQVLPGRINGQSTSQRAEPRTTETVSKHLLSTEQDHSLMKESAPPPETSFLLMPALLDPSLLWTSHCMDLPVYAFPNMSFYCGYFVLGPHFYEYFWREVGQQIVFEFLCLWNKGTRYQEYIDFILDVAPGWNFGARGQSVSEIVNCPMKSYSLSKVRFLLGCMCSRASDYDHSPIESSVALWLAVFSRESE